MTEERELLRAARRFDLAALAEIYDCYSPGIYRYAMRLLGDEFLAEECLSDTFDRFLKALKRGGGPQDALQAYLYRIAHNWITDHYRRAPLPETELADELGSQQPDQFEEHPASAAEVRHALQNLTEDQRAAVILRYLEGWENEEIARLLSKQVGAVKALQQRGLAALRRQLQREGGEE